MRAQATFTFDKACKALWLIEKMGWTQTQAANFFGVNQGVICHVVHGRRYPDAFPVPSPDLPQASLARPPK